MFLIAFPLLLIPFALYNMMAFLLDTPVTTELYAIPLPADRHMAVTIGDALVVLAMLLLYLEVLKAARARKAVMDHLLALILFAAMAAEFALVPQAQTPAFLFITVLAFVDLLIGVSVSRRARRHDIMVEDDGLPPP
jgi:hypothetical protein